VKPAPMWDDRTPMILITFDGLGDRPADELGNQTPLEAARTPNLDELTRIGVSGIHQPFGRLPAQRMRTPMSFISSRRLRMTSRLKFIRNRTSSGDRRQFSVENA
jgi:hypothetical protein